MLDNARFEAEQMGKQLEITAPPGPWTLFGNASALDSALENIVRNALRYSHTRIAVAFSADNQGVTIRLTTTAPASVPKTASRSSVRSTAPMKRATANPAAPASARRSSKRRSTSIAAG